MYFLFNYESVCGPGYECKYLGKPEALDPLEAGVPGGCEAPDVGDGN